MISTPAQQLAMKLESSCGRETGPLEKHHPGSGRVSPLHQDAQQGLP